MINIERETN